MDIPSRRSHPPNRK